MPSPFPGFDPYLESQMFHSFHTQFITAINQALAPQVLPRYMISVEDAACVIDEYRSAAYIFPDVGIADTEQSFPLPGAHGEGGETAVALMEPITREVPRSVPEHHHFVEIRNRFDHSLVTIIEMLSPKNKASGWQQYESKRQTIFQAGVNLVEIDLLRGGRRVSTTEPLPPCDYCATVCRGQRLPEIDVYAWRLEQPLPNIPIPLLPGDDEATLPLQEVFTQTYDRGGFGRMLDYGRELFPPLEKEREAWVKACTSSGG